MQEPLLIRSAFKKPIERYPVWMMRQAGRYLQEYRDTKEKAGGFLGLCTTPNYAVEVCLQPIERFGFDAVILFSDIMIPLIAMGMDIDFKPGPIIKDPIRSDADIDRLIPFDPSDKCRYVGDILSQLRKSISPETALIGFAAAPFTLACYAAKDQDDKNFYKIRELYYHQTESYKKLIDKITTATIEYLRYQIETGAQVIQLFDTWAGLLARDDYLNLAYPYVQKIFTALKETAADVPIIYYSNGTHHLLDDIMQLDADVISVDWRISLSDAQSQFEKSLQGNLDPAVLFSHPELVEKKVTALLETVKTKTGFIFNLGHGVDKNTPIENVHSMVNAVKSFKIA